MTVIERLFPSIGRRHLREALQLAYHSALGYAQLRKVDVEQPRIYKMWSFIACHSNKLLVELLVKNSNQRIDWKLKSHIDSVTSANLAVLFYWMILFCLRVFHETINSSPRRNDDFFRLCALAHKWPSFIEQNTSMTLPTRNVFSGTWSGDPLPKVALDLYNSFHRMLGLEPDPKVALVHTTLFIVEVQRTAADAADMYFEAAEIRHDSR